MKFIGNLIKDEVITPAQGRSIETFIIGLGFSFVLGILDNVEIFLNGGEVDWKAFFVMFATATSTSIVLGIRKHIRDMEKEIVDNVK